MFQPRGEEGEEKEVSGWRLKKYLRMRDNQLRPEFRKPADVPMDGPSANGRGKNLLLSFHTYQRWAEFRVFFYFRLDFRKISKHFRLPQSCSAEFEVFSQIVFV